MTTIILSEGLKLTISVLFITLRNAPAFPTLSYPAQSTRSTLTAGHQDAILPAILYTTATYLQSVGARNLDLLPYLMLSQAKFITTPIFSMIFLNRRFSGRNWACFFLIILGITMVQTSPATSSTKDVFQGQFPSRNTNLGLFCMLLSGTIVALASIRVEMMLQASKPFMSRNAHLAWYSSLSAILGFICKSKQGAVPFFHGYNHLVWSFVLLQATGGFLVAWCVSLTNTVTKNYAQAVGFLLASTAPFILQQDFHFQVTCS